MSIRNKRVGVLAALLAVLVALCAPVMARAEEPTATSAAVLVEGVNIVQQGAENTTYNIDEGKVVMIANQSGAEPIVFKNCTFTLGGATVKISGNQGGISYNNGETATKLFISGNVQFDNCTFVTAAGAEKSTTAGWDAAIYFFNGDINLNNCSLTSEGYNGQFLGLYGSSGAVTFDGCNISTKDNVNGWSYAMYARSVLNLKNSTMSATGMTRTGSNINAFYSGDLRTEYDAINIENSTIDFHDNQAGGFAINNVNIRVKDSKIYVNDNLGNACNSGRWYVEGSTIQMNGNRGGHGLSCISFDMTDSRLEILHNGYAGVYIQKYDSTLTNCSVDIRCNGEKLLSYTAGDVWLNGHKLTVNGGTSEAQEGSPWLGAMGRKGSLTTIGKASVVAYDLNSNAADNLKSNTAPMFADAAIALNGDENAHTLFLNPFMTSDYARGNAEKASNNDADLFKDDKVTNRTDIIGAENAKIGTLTDAQLAHHIYDWANGVVTDQATETTYGVIQYTCTDVCADYVGHTAGHPWSFDCAGTYVYAPLVGVTFDANVEEGVTVTGMPEAQTQIAYEGTAVEPADAPVRESAEGEGQWIFTGWYIDPECTQKFDFTTTLTENWTVLYAGWQQAEPVSAVFSLIKSYVDSNGNAMAIGVDQFEFELIDDVTGQVIETVSANADGSIVFSALSFDAEGTYKYTVREVAGDDENITYDENEIHCYVEVKLEEAEDGTLGLVATPLCVEKNTFTNVYTKPAAPVTPEGTIPATGDVLPTAGVMAALAACGIAVVAGARVISKRRG